MLLNYNKIHILTKKKKTWLVNKCDTFFGNNEEKNYY